MAILSSPAAPKKTVGRSDGDPGLVDPCWRLWPKLGHLELGMRLGYSVVGSWGGLLMVEVCR